MEYFESLEQLLIITNMMDDAADCGLLAEVVLSYGYACSINKPYNTEDYKQCAEQALNEWIK